MKKSILACAIVLALLLVLAAPVAAAEPPDKVRVFIGFAHQPGQSEEGLVKSLGGNIKYTYRIIPAIAAYVPETAIPALLRNPRVTVVEPDITIHATDELGNSWGVEHIGAVAVHDSGNTGAGVKVAIIDTGLDYNNPEFAGRYAGGYDFVNGDDDPMDDEGHGTHVAGIIAAADDGSGVVGVAPEAQIYALKVLDSSGSGSFFDVIAALDWVCGDYGSPPKALITNNSYGSNDYPGSLVQMAFDFADSLWGVLNIAAAGNSGILSGIGDNVEYPGRFASVVAVAATDRNDVRGYFSSTGPDVELSAPGIDVTSTVLDDQYETWNGTSMASPHVAGTAALVIASGIKDANRDGFLNDDVRQRLTSTARDLGDPNRDSWYGYGLVDAAAAAMVTTQPPPSEQKTVTVSNIQTGTYVGRGRNKTFQETSLFTAGDMVVFQVNVTDSNGQPVPGAVVLLNVTGPEETSLTTNVSGSDGIAIATWQTKAPRRRSQGTAIGDYSAQAGSVAASGYVFDGNSVYAPFSIR
jgi:subtilisin